jgi:hypothetical protein
MSNFIKDGKVFGVVPHAQYLKIAYLLMLGGGVLNLLSFMLALGSIAIGLGQLAMLLSVVGLLMVVLGLLVLGEDFSALEKNHFLYICVLFVALYVLGGIIGNTGVLVLALLVSLAGLFMLYVGYNSWSKGRMITKDNVAAEVQLATKRA